MQLPREGARKTSRQVKRVLDGFFRQIDKEIHRLRSILLSDEPIKEASDEHMIKRWKSNQVQVARMKLMMTVQSNETICRSSDTKGMYKVVIFCKQMPNNLYDGLLVHTTVTCVTCVKKQETVGL